MTCIVGLVNEDNGEVWLGGDSAGVANQRMDIRADPKVFRIGDFAMGFTSSFRMGQLLQYKFNYHQNLEGTLKECRDGDLFQFMATEFIDRIRTILKEGGFAKVDNNVETGGAFLVGIRGRLFTIHDDFQVAENVFPFTAIGSGEEFALGSLYATGRGGLEPIPAPVRRVDLALKTAEAFTTSVSRPFHFVVTEPSANG